jgi:hypothetical protein
MTEAQRAAREENRQAYRHAERIANAIEGTRGEKARRAFRALSAQHTDRSFALANEWNLAALERGEAQDWRDFAARWSESN